MFFISSEKEINIEELMCLLKQTYWAAERPEEKVRKSLEHSVCYGAFDENDKLVGFARVVTDCMGSMDFRMWIPIERCTGK